MRRGHSGKRSTTDVVEMSIPSVWAYRGPRHTYIHDLTIGGIHAPHAPSDSRLRRGVASPRDRAGTAVHESRQARRALGPALDGHNGPVPGGDRTRRRRHLHWRPANGARAPRDEG